MFPYISIYAQHAKKLTQSYHSFVKYPLRLDISPSISTCLGSESFDTMPCHHPITTWRNAPVHHFLAWSWLCDAATCKIWDGHTGFIGFSFPTSLNILNIVRISESKYILILEAKTSPKKSLNTSPSIYIMTESYYVTPNSRSQQANRCLWPPPHVAEQSLHGDHRVHSQSICVQKWFHLQKYKMKSIVLSLFGPQSDWLIMFGGGRRTSQDKHV